MTPCQSLESNSPLLSNRSRKFSGKIPNGHKHGIYQSKTSSLRDFTQPQRKISPFRKSPANYRPPRIVLDSQINTSIEPPKSFTSCEAVMTESNYLIEPFEHEFTEINKTKEYLNNLSENYNTPCISRASNLPSCPP